ncbi:very short patch repair endonuclease [Blastomonas marina]|uniref:Very short patch repair endonuclease n=1 Tax=Blastomonas marina TaxID=1867408 RepID=A0ABQ1F8R6_9SPHN|nr:DNA mismatch endonuclease Vsr [Blastomonas marina]GGA02656.1 very short patch repair endonuclease [Blastomonas marina]
MVDNLSPEERSRLMSRVRGKDTNPEMAVRRLVHKLGYRFRLHRRDLPGTPDLVFPGKKKVIFVHGCYWHRHDCKKATTPKTNVEFWENKFDANIMRDNKNLNDLSELGWETMVVWQCEAEKPEEIVDRLVEFLELGR